jgi:Tle cognate immunity protein 4 C-terminal domain
MTWSLQRPLLVLDCLRAAATLVLAIAAGGCAADEASAGWRSDCVGRFAIALPGQAQIAVMPNDYLMPMMSLRHSNGAPKHAFDDGEAAGYATLGYATGSLLVSQPQPPERLHTLVQAHVAARLTQARKSYEGRAAPNGGKYSFSIVDTGTATATAWRADPGPLYVAAQVGDRLVDLSIGAESAAIVMGGEPLNVRLQSLRPRDVLTVPTEVGTCFPYLFVMDDGQQRRHIAMTYRLDATPDIQLTFKDATAADPEPGVRTKNAEPDAVTVSFWSQLLTQAKEVKPLWTPTTRSVKLAGYTGVASFVQLTRADNTVDYGYLAVVRGDPKAKEDTPDLMLYVVQDSKQAKAKGKEPMSKAAFIAMAEGVAASVRRRPVSGR